MTDVGGDGDDDGDGYDDSDGDFIDDDGSEVDLDQETPRTQPSGKEGATCWLSSLARSSERQRSMIILKIRFSFRKEKVNIVHLRKMIPNHSQLLSIEHYTCSLMISQVSEQMILSR